MIHSSVDKHRPKGWFLGPWNSKVPIPLGYANRGIDEQHYHKHMFEIYFVANGESTMVVDGKKTDLKAGDMVVVEPLEVHSFIRSSDNYLHFVINVPFVKDDKVAVK
jgi:mannose-6-phosphate isomerase-like protein (cupin superfamily)